MYLKGFHWNTTVYYWVSMLANMCTHWNKYCIEIEYNVLVLYYWYKHCIGSVLVLYYWYIDSVLVLYYWYIDRILVLYYLQVGWEGLGQNSTAASGREPVWNYPSSLHWKWSRFSQRERVEERYGAVSQPLTRTITQHGGNKNGNKKLQMTNGKSTHR